MGLYEDFPNKPGICLWIPQQEIIMGNVAGFRIIGALPHCYKRFLIIADACM